MPRNKKRKYNDRDSHSDNDDDLPSGGDRKKRKLLPSKPSKRSNRSKSCTSKTVRKSKRLAKKKKKKQTLAPFSKKHKQSISSPLQHTDTRSDTDVDGSDDNKADTEHNIDNKASKPIDHNQPLFDDSCSYALLEVFLVAFDLECDIQKPDSIRDDLWEWLWFWEQRSSAFYRILITPVYEHNLFEIRVDSIHGIHCGLFSEFLITGLTFEYYYAYSRGNIWGGWKFVCNHKTIKQDLYGNIFNDTSEDSYTHCIQPSKIWKQIIWFKQLKMELMYKKYGGINMNKMHLTHYYYGHHNFNEIDGNHEVYINKFPPYQNSNNNKAKIGKKGNVKRDKFDVYSYNMAQIFDNSWCKNHLIDANSIQLNVDDLSMILGTKEKMRCAQCRQTLPLCRAIKLCECFKGCFFVRDLYHRHQSMVMDWK